MRVHATISLGQLDKKLAALEEAGKQTMLDALKATTLDIHAEAIRGIQEVSFGHEATRYNPKREVIVSAEGDPFNTDTGGTVGSIQFGVDEAALIGEVGSNSKVALWLEMGTKTMKARPWLRPALKMVNGFVAKLKFRKDMVK